MITSMTSIRGNVIFLFLRGYQSYLFEIFFAVFVIESKSIQYIIIKLDTCYP